MTFKNRANTQNLEAIVDDTGVLVGIEYAHDAVHRDIFVIASEYVADLDIASPRVYYLKAPTGYEMHSVLKVKSSSPCRVELYEDPTISDPGTAISHMRSNRKSSIADNARLSSYHSPTVTENGTKIYDNYTGGSEGGFLSPGIGGETRPGEELVLPASKSYRLVVTATANDTIMSFLNEYYEVSE
jgi:hypothetical protein